MARKPWPIIVLAIFHILEPVFKVLFYCTLWKMPVGAFVSYMVHHTKPLELFLFTCSFPIAGIAIFAVKKWSLPAFLAVQLVTLGGHIYYHVYAPKAFPISVVVTMSLLNLAVVTYFLLPAVRIAYLDPKVRWWEAKPRFVVDWKGTIFQGKTKLDMTLNNISEGGLFLTAGKGATLAIEEPVKVEFDFLNVHMNLPGRIRHYNGTGAAKYGVQFTELSKEQKSQLRRCARTLHSLSYPRQGLKDDPIESFKLWVKTLVTTGRGLLPEMTQTPAKKTQISVGSNPERSSTPTAKSA